MHLHCTDSLNRAVERSVDRMQDLYAFRNGGRRHTDSLPLQLVSMTFTSISSQKYNPNASSLPLIRLILLVDAAIDRFRPPVVQIVMQLTVTGPELELFQKQGIIVEREGIADVKFGLLESVRYHSSMYGKELEEVAESFLTFLASMSRSCPSCSNRSFSAFSLGLKACSVA